MAGYHIPRTGVDVETKTERENIEAFEMWCYRRALMISYVEHVSNDEVVARMSQSRKVLSRVKSRKLKYFGHVARHRSKDKDIMLDTMPGTRRQGEQKWQWLDDITDWTELELSRVVYLAGDRREFRSVVHSIVHASHGA